jgi:transposase InsO family protein
VPSNLNRNLSGLPCQNDFAGSVVIEGFTWTVVGRFYGSRQVRSVRCLRTQCLVDSIIAARRRYARSCLAPKKHKDGRSIRRAQVARELVVFTELFAVVVPRAIRSDNGPGCVAHAIRRLLDQLGTQSLYIEPGSPWENGYAESFPSRLRDEFRGQTVR